MKTQRIDTGLLIPVGILFLLSGILHQSHIYTYTNARFLYVMIGCLLALPLYLLAGIAAAHCSEGGLLCTIERRFGTAVSLIFALCFAVAGCMVGAGFLRTYTELISLISLSQTPLWILCLPMLAAALCLILKGPMALGRWSHFVLPGILIILGLGFALSLKNADFSNLSPLLYGERELLLPRGAITMLTAFSQATLLLIPASACADRQKAPRAMIRILLIGGAILSLSALQNVLLLGSSSVRSAYFTAFSAFSLIDVSPLLQRMEILIFVLLMVAGICNIALSLHVLIESADHLTRHRSKKWVTATAALLTAGVAAFSRPRITDVFQPAVNTWIYFVLFHIALPVAASILVLLPRRRPEGAPTHPQR